MIYNGPAAPSFLDMRLIPVLLLAAAALPSSGQDLKLNQIQAIGSHNSYHMAPPEALMKTVVKINKDAAAWNYTHPPLAQQLEIGVRQFELDIFVDSKADSSPTRWR